MEAEVAPEQPREEEKQPRLGIGQCAAAVEGFVRSCGGEGGMGHGDCGDRMPLYGSYFVVGYLYKPFTSIQKISLSLKRSGSVLENPRKTS